jgi:hypothetical protein
LKENELASLRESAAKYVAVARAHAARQAAA